MGIIFAIILVFIVWQVIFVLLHLRPLTEQEITELAKERRKQDILWYYSFHSCEDFLEVDEFKKKMNPKGQFYTIHKSLKEFPDYAASLLKGKKHEWIIFAFEKDRIVDKIWLNKGFDNKSVGSFLNRDEAFKIAQNGGYTSFLMLHNHPTHETHRYAFHHPSDTDIDTATQFSELLNKINISYLSFICERGNHHIHYLSVSKSFYPIEQHIKGVMSCNNQTKWKNFQLHRERFLNKKWPSYLRNV